MSNLYQNIINLDFGLLKIKKIHACIIILIFIIFKCQIKFLLPVRKKKNFYICLGSNCYPRKMLSRIGIKPRKKEGELSCPFDLCATEVHNISKILENNFADYVENIICEGQHPTNKKFIYRNSKYNINYIHDNTLNTVEQVKKRYAKRIENFINLSANNEEIAYLLCVFNNEFIPEDLNKIYDSLFKYRKNKPFKFAVFSFTDKYTNTKEKLNPGIIYNEYIPDCKASVYKYRWFIGKLTYNEPAFLSFYEDVCKL